MIKEFPKNIHDMLKYYVYIYIDPRDGKIFYVGKGIRNRAFAHLSEESEKEKVKRVKEMQSDGFEPIIEVLVHGIKDDKTVKKIEASVIDLLDIRNLTNIQRGYESREFGRMSLEQIVATYNIEKARITEPVILININKTFRYGMPQIELYDATRSAWVVGDRRNGAKYAIAIYQGIIQEIYEIMGWFPNNSTFNTRKPEKPEIEKDRWEFVGRIADVSFRNKYRYKYVSEYLGTQNPIHYLNC